MVTPIIGLRILPRYRNVMYVWDCWILAGRFARLSSHSDSYGICKTAKVNIDPVIPASGDDCTGRNIKG